MSLAGRDYHQVFEEACREITGARDAAVVRRELLRLEGVLWDGIGGVFMRISLTIASLAVLLPVYLLDLPQSLSLGLVVAGSLFALTALIYGLCRLVFYIEIGRHVGGRRFGEQPEIDLESRP
ncbi:MAG TPA: hypothetical protein VGO22_10150 [Pseudorhizobium sp.]|nr:hypothetical protein [Pseudorhizobium sp.]